MSDATHTTRAIALAALVTLSAFAGLAASTGTDGSAVAPTTGTSAGDGAVAGGPDSRALNADGTGEFDTLNGAGYIFPNATVFQGEDDVQFGSPLRSSLVGVSGNAAGVVLSPPIPRDAPLGIYSNDGTTDTPSVILDRPRVTKFEIQNRNGADITDESVTRSSADRLVVVAEYNYHEAEDLELAVYQSNGLEITNEVTDSPNPQNGAGTVSWDVDLSDQAAGSYTFEVSGSDNLDEGTASEEGGVTVASSGTVDIRVDRRTVTRGEYLGFTVTGGNPGDAHLVRIKSSDFRRGQSADAYARIFRHVEDTRSRGYFDASRSSGDQYLDIDSPTDRALVADIDPSSGDYAWAVVEIDDGGLGQGQVDTQNLDTTSVDLQVSSRLTDSTPRDIEISGIFGAESAVTVEEGAISISGPGNSYVVDSEVGLTGTAPAGTDEVAFYARAEGDYQLVAVDSRDTVAVDSDGTFAAENVRLSDGDFPGNKLLSLPGAYTFGVIDAADADVDSNDNGDGPDESLTVQEFDRGTSSRRSLWVLPPDVASVFTSPIDGEIAIEDGDVDVAGSAPGAQEVLFVAIGSRGGLVTRVVPVHRDNTFDQAGIDISSLGKGAVSLHVYSLGRDDVVGDGSLPTGDAASISGLVAYLDSLSRRSLTADQIRSALLTQTTGDTASDDLMVSENVRLVDARTTIDSVYPVGRPAPGINRVQVGQTFVVEGTTNLQPGDNTVVVELESGDSTVGLASTDSWGSNGNWSVELRTADATAGTYTLSVDDGANTVATTVELVEQSTTPTETQTPTEQPTETQTPTQTTTPTTTVTETQTPTEQSTGQTGPGFGGVVAILALFVVSLLARRHI